MNTDTQIKLIRVHTVCCHSKIVKSAYGYHAADFIGRQHFQEKKLRIRVKYETSIFTKLGDGPDYFSQYISLNFD